MGRNIVNWLVIFILAYGFGFLIHGMLLQPDYIAMPPDMWRPQAVALQKMPFMLLGYAFYAAALVWIYKQGVKAGAWLPQGIRFGIAVWALTSVPFTLILYTVEMYRWYTAAKIMGMEFVPALILGVITAAFHQRPVMRTTS